MSVRKRTWKTESGEVRSTYVVQYSTPEKDSRGKRTRHVKAFDKKKDAQTFESQVRVDVRKGVHVPDSKSLTIEEAGRGWIDSCGDLERTTRDGYEQHLRDHINPFIGAVRLPALAVAGVRDWQDKLRKAGRSADMVKRVTTSLGSLLADAQERGKVGQNVVRSLKANRKRGKERQAERRAKGRLKVGVDIPTPPEIDAILGAVKGKWRPFMLVAIRCGLRASELRGLRWIDIDFDAAVLHVRQRADAHNVIGPPKSEAGERTIPVPSITLKALREWKKQCPKGALVFPNGQGHVENHANIVQRGLWPCLIAAGVTKPGKDADGKPISLAKYSGLHALRHFYASWCINRPPIGLGMNLKELQIRLGHSNIAVTADTYSHLFPRDDEAAELAAAEGKFG
jgi:integrase